MREPGAVREETEDEIRSKRVDNDRRHPTVFFLEWEGVPMMALRMYLNS